MNQSTTKVVTTVSIAHGLSHFNHLLLAPLFPFIKAQFGLSYAELGLLMTVFFTVSGVGQALSGFLVDRIGPVKVMLGSIALFVAAALVLALAPNYAVLMLGSVFAGLGNAAFHPIDYSILNARIAPEKLGTAYAVHGISGNLGWAVAPLFLLTITSYTSWHVAIGAAGVLAAAIWVLVFVNRESLEPREVVLTREAANAKAALPTGSSRPQSFEQQSSFAFLTLPAVWMSFAFFFAYAVALGGVQSFGAEAASKLHAVDPRWIAYCLSSYMVFSACAMLIGGQLVKDPSKADKVVAFGFASAALVALVIALAPVSGLMVPALFGLMGFCSGLAGPSRDLLIKRAAPPGATGRVYGVVYSGLDAGMAIAPFVFGLLMDAQQPLWVWIGIALFQALLIASAVGVGSFAKRQQAALQGAQ